MSRSLRTGLFLLVMLGLLSIALPMSAQDNTLIMARAVDATGLDPHTQTAFVSLAALSMIYEPLVTTDNDLNLIPALATGWSFSEDGLKLTMNLRQGVTFHDGSDFTAEDVIASFTRLLNPDVASAAATNYASITSMEAPDDYTVVFNLSQPDVPLLAAMASTNAVILSSDVIANEDPALVTIGTGPFKLAEWTPEEKMVLAANEDWWGDGPYVDGIEVRIIPDEASILAALRAGTIDFAYLNDPLVATLLVDDANVTLHRTPVLSYNVLQLRAAVEPLDKLEVRQAISCAINRQEIVDSAALGEGRVTGPLTMASFALPTDDLFCYEQDVAKAQELMAAAGMETGFTLPVMVANAEPPTATAIAQVIQAQLDAINITVEIESLELNTYVDRWLAGDFSAAVALNGGRTDPYTMYARYWQYDARFQNVAGYIDDSLDSLMKQGQVETDPAARYEIFAQLQRELAEKAPWVWLYAPYTYTAHQSYVSGWEPTANDSLYFLYAAQINR
ncbi:MAG: ABC transporter substrate-binding protein [Anaerolineaceae bacterium]|nr:ABC transporter substrate-binding protein [Anaerolineaceae bacterium]